MKTIIFLCHGNICRSPAAEYIMNDLLEKASKTGLFYVFSRALSYEEIGNDIYPPMKEELFRLGIKTNKHRAQIITQEDYEKADYIFYMDSSNRNRIPHYINDYKHICYPINKWTPSIDYIEDPWYTDRYKKVCTEITQCILDILKNIID